MITRHKSIPSVSIEGYVIPPQPIGTGATGGMSQ